MNKEDFVAILMTRINLLKEEYQNKLTSSYSGYFNGDYYTERIDELLNLIEHLENPRIK